MSSDNTCFSQAINIKGRIVDIQSGEPIPFVNIVVKGSLAGWVSDSTGNFLFQVPTGRKRDTLLISALGYEMQLVPLSPLSEQYLHIELQPNLVHLKEAIIRPGENPAFRIMRKLIENKGIHNIENKSAYEYDAYHKVEFDLNNFTEKTKRNIFLRSFSFIFENADTTADGVNYLPILLTESYSSIYYRKNPLARKELIKGRRSVGLKGPKIMKFAEEMYLSPDIYKEFIVILDKNFPSPLNDNYKAHYRFYLLDSLLLDGKRCYYLQFKPKNKADIAFSGEMYVEDSSFVVKQITLEFSISANVNFVRNYWIRQDYERKDEKHTILVKSKVIGDFTVMENSSEMTGFFGKKTSEYRNYKFDEIHEESFYRSLDRTTFEDSSAFRNEIYWDQVRKAKLNKEENSIVTMIDTLQKQRKFRVIKSSVKSITSGWIPIKQFELGDFYTFYSYNNVEHSRFKLGIRAQHLFQDRMRFKSYLAYGSNDKQFKYLTEAQFVLTRNRAKETRVGVKIKKDALQPGRSSTIFPLDQVLNSFTNLGSFKNRSLVKEHEFHLERQWILGFSSRISVYQNVWSDFGNNNFEIKLSEQISYKKTTYTYSGIQLSLRYAFGESNLSAAFGDGRKGYAFQKYPVISVCYEKAIENFWESEFTSDKLKIRLEEKLRVAKLGYSLIRLEAGKTWGILPYPFLETPLANPILFNDETAFNTMNYLEFVNDQYISLMFEHHFEGILFNRVPLVKKLKWRELLLAKMYAGSISEKNRKSNYLLPEGAIFMTEPYLEIGFGIENIFKFSRVDFLWRLSYRDKNGTYNFIAKPMFQFKF